MDRFVFLASTHQYFMNNFFSGVSTKIKQAVAESESSESLEWHSALSEAYATLQVSRFRDDNDLVIFVIYS